MIDIDDKELDLLLLSFIQPSFLKVARVLGDAHESFDDWSEAALARSIERLVVLHAQGEIEIAGDVRSPRESEVKRRRNHAGDRKPEGE